MDQHLHESFEKAVESVKNLKSRPTNDELLKLYGLYKQASEGDVQGKRPGMIDFKGRAKYDAWSELKGMSRDDAMQMYVKLVTQLQKRYG